MRLDRLTIKVQEALMSPLAMRLLDGTLSSGHTVTVEENGAEELLFKGS